MPQAPTRRDNTQVQRAQDKESKRARGALSCAECRRLKLKCDKTVPCSSCKRRGCSEICPNGSLITGQGTRFVLADTETLHQKIAHMSDRIRQLEDALAILQSTLSGTDPHPLLQRDLLKIKSSIELHSASRTNGGPEEAPVREEEGDLDQSIDAFGTLAIRDDGAGTFYGWSAGSEALLIDESSTTPPSSDIEPSPHLSSASSYADFGNPSNYLQSPDHYSRTKLANDGNKNVSGSIADLAASFPLAPSISYTLASDTTSVLSPLSAASSSLVTSLQRLTLQDFINNYLPPFVEAQRLVQLYLEQAPWFFGAATRRQIDEEILPLWYEEAAVNYPSAASTPPGGLVRHSSASGSPNGSSGKQERAKSSHDLALLFVIFCFGALTDTNLPSPPDNAPAEKFYQLTKAALSLDPGSPTDAKTPRNGVLERPPSVSTVQTLSLMAIYEGMCSGENSIESTWALMGLSCKLAQSIGLHRDCARWKLTTAEVQKRRGLFWELFITDCWQSLATGRLATFSLPFVDCELPSDPDQTMADDGSIQPSFSYWKARFGAECVSAVVQGTLTSRAPKYSIILDLDRKVRDMELPIYAQGPPPEGVGLAQTMSHFMPQNYRELTLLYIHRCFFAHALTTNPLDPIKSQYAPSFLAGYRSACTIIASIRTQFQMFPAQIARFWVLWTHAFSGAVMLASVPTHSPRSKIAAAAMLELKNACDLFEAAAAYGGKAVKCLRVLKRMQLKAQKSFRDSTNGVPPNIANDIFKPSKPNDNKDELSIFSGKTHTVSTKSVPQAATSNSTSVNSISLSGRNSSKSSPRASSDSPQQIFTDNPSFAGVHPSLVSDLHSFQGQIKAQIQTAYRSGEELFIGAPMVIDPILPAGPSPGPSNVSPHQYLPQSSDQHRSNEKHIPQDQHHQGMYQQGRHRQSSQHEMLDRQRTEVQSPDRQELERQELARQHMEHQLRQQEIQKQQYHQHESQRHHHSQKSAIPHQKSTRQHDLPQQQRQEYRQPYGNQQEQQMGHYRQPYNTEPVQHGYGSAQGDPASSAPQRRSSQPQPQHGAQQYQQSSQQHYQTSAHHSTQLPQNGALSHANSSSHARMSQHHLSQQHTGSSEPPTYGQVAHQQQQPMYQIPPEYPHQPSLESIHTSSSSIGYMPPLPPSSYSEPSVASTPTATYWPVASQSFAMPDQQSTMAYGAGPSHQQYTPEGALRGIAADDRSLQETWQSYMAKVGSPRFLED